MSRLLMCILLVSLGSVPMLRKFPWPFSCQEGRPASNVTRILTCILLLSSSGIHSCTSEDPVWDKTASVDHWGMSQCLGRSPDPLLAWGGSSKWCDNNIDVYSDGVIDRNTFVYFRRPCARQNYLCRSLRNVSYRERNVSVLSVRMTSRKERSVRYGQEM